MMPSVDLASAVGHIPSGLFIVAVQDTSENSIPDAYLASWVQQVSFSPLMISLAIRPGRPAYDLIKSDKVFSINIVGEHDKSFLKHFWKGYDPDFNPFNELKFEIGENGGVLLPQAKSVIECQAVEFVQPGDHEVVFAKVLASYIFNDESRPMTHVRKSGNNY